MDINFNSSEELFKRVKPAIHAKIEELKRLNFKNVKDIDIWNYLIEEKWKNGNNLALSDIVNDIINLDNKRFNEYLKK